MPSLISTPANPGQTRAAGEQTSRSGAWQLFENWRLATPATKTSPATTTPTTSQARKFNHNGKAYRLESPDKLVLVGDSKEGPDDNNFAGSVDSYKCLAINIMGEQASESLSARHNCEFLFSIFVVPSSSSHQSKLTEAIDSRPLIKIVRFVCLRLRLLWPAQLLHWRQAAAAAALTNCKISRWQSIRLQRATAQLSQQKRSPVRWSHSLRRAKFIGLLSASASWPSL